MTRRRRGGDCQQIAGAKLESLFVVWEKREEEEGEETNSRSQARVAIYLVGEDRATNKAEAEQNERQRLLLELKGHGKLDSA